MGEFVGQEASETQDANTRELTRLTRNIDTLLRDPKAIRLGAFVIPKAYAAGGRPTTRTVALVGEQKPEAVVNKGGMRVYDKPTMGVLNPGDTVLPGLGGLRSAKYGKDLGDAAKREHFMALVNAETGGQGPVAQQGFIETVLNRGMARGETLDQLMANKLYFPTRTQKLAVAGLQPEQRAVTEPLLGTALAGSNMTNFATGNASYDPKHKFGKEGFFGYGGTGGTTFIGGKPAEYFGQEKTDESWAEAMRGLALGGGLGAGSGSDPLVAKIPKPDTSLASEPIYLPHPLSTIEAGGGESRGGGASGEFSGGFGPDVGAPGFTEATYPQVGPSQQQLRNQAAFEQLPFGETLRAAGGLASSAYQSAQATGGIGKAALSGTWNFLKEEYEHLPESVAETATTAGIGTAGAVGARVAGRAGRFLEKEALKYGEHLEAPSAVGRPEFAAVQALLGQKPYDVTEAARQATLPQVPMEGRYGTGADLDKPMANELQVGQSGKIKVEMDNPPPGTEVSTEGKVFKDTTTETTRMPLAPDDEPKRYSNPLINVFRGVAGGVERLRKVTGGGDDADLHPEYSGGGIRG
jgi:hypothetical protein